MIDFIYERDINLKLLKAQDDWTYFYYFSALFGFSSETAFLTSLGFLLD